jgi:riboflavin kinase/FMN adenylyltransferase
VSVSVAVGVFDGLHLGHRSLIERALARAGGGRCVAVSFDPHPDIVLAKEFRALPPLTPLPEKQERLAAMGVDLHVLPVTRELFHLDGLTPQPGERRESSAQASRAVPDQRSGCRTRTAGSARTGAPC